MGVALGVLLVQRGLRLEIAHPEPPSPVLESIPQHRKQPSASQALLKAVQNFRTGFTGFCFSKNAHSLLGLLHKADQGIHKQPQLGVVAIPIAGVAPGRESSAAAMSDSNCFSVVMIGMIETSL